MRVRGRENQGGKEGGRGEEWEGGRSEGEGEGRREGGRERGKARFFSRMCVNGGLERWGVGGGERRHERGSANLNPCHSNSETIDTITA